MNFGMEKPEEISKVEWMGKLQSVHITRADMNKLIMNYLVTEGFKEAAEKFKMESGIQPDINPDELDDRIRIRDAIQNGRIQEAISLVNDLHPELLDNDRYLYFHLQFPCFYTTAWSSSQDHFDLKNKSDFCIVALVLHHWIKHYGWVSLEQQHLIELIREKNIEGALDYAQTHLAERGEENPEILSELERTLALLAFEEPEKSPFGELLHLSQRQKVASELNAAILELDSTDSTPKLANLLKLLLWSQEELDKAKVKYPRMTDLATGTIEDAGTSKS